MERKILAQSGIVQNTWVADVHLMTWKDTKLGVASKEDFTSLAGHCSYK